MCVWCGVGVCGDEGVCGVFLCGFCVDVVVLMCVCGGDVDDIVGVDVW